MPHSHIRLFDKDKINLNALTFSSKVEAISAGVLKKSPVDYLFLDSEWQEGWNIVHGVKTEELAVNDGLRKEL